MPPDRLSIRLDSWKRQLIDLTRRNRLLNYRPTKASTVEIVDEVPQLILRQLLGGGTLQFDPKPELDEPASYRQDSSALLETRHFEIGRRLGRGDSEGNPDYHTDDRLQTALVDKRLQHNLLSIYRRAEASLEEQGVNTLFLALGMLEWHEREDSRVTSRAPLVMVPVELRRRTAASPFLLALGDDDPLLNPAIVEKLRLDFRIELPELPEMTDDLDVDRIFDGIREAVSGFPDWQLTADVALGLFSFQKFIMYRDLERHEERFRAHRVIRAISQEGDAQGVVGLPPDVADANLDEEMSPSVSVQVLDADSSQQRAILAVKKNHDLVIEGPPGTGKSQTITNLIADALNDGKTVLFVAEKRAALEVVETRLEHDAGLGDHILELHSNKASKREFVETLTHALDQLETVGGDHADELARLQELTNDLREYVIELHTPVEPLDQSPYQAIASLAEVEDKVQRIDATVPELEQAGRESLRVACDRLVELARALEDVGDPETHPLRGIGLETAGRSERARLEQTLGDASSALAALTDAAFDVSERLGLRSISTLGDAQLIIEGARTVAKSPGSDVSVLENEAWNQMSSEATDLLTAGARFAQLRPRVMKRFRPEILERDTAADVSEYGRQLQRGAWRFLSPGYWGVRARLRRLLAAGYKPENARSFLADLKTAEACRTDLNAIRAADDTGRELFGSRWNGPASDWVDLKAFAEWVVQFRSYALKDLLGERGIQTAAKGHLNSEETGREIHALEGAFKSAGGALAAVSEAGALTDEAGITTEPSARIGDLSRRLAAMEEALDQLRSYSAFVAARRACNETLAHAYVPVALESKLPPKKLMIGFRRLFFELWLDRVVAERPKLARFHTAQHEERIKAFRRLDLRSLDIARERAISALSDRRMELMSGDLAGQLQVLQHEARKRRRIMPVRRLLARTPDAIQRIKPCFLMSPLSVAQYVDPDAMTFDLIVFDEASQIPPADAIGAIIRAEKVVVVGDSKQLPPTNFFGAQLDDDGLYDDEEVEVLEDLESILDEVAVAGIPSVRLKWHYRSQHQSLIRFSNEEFYADDPMYVFPAALRHDPGLGLKFEFVDDGVYGGGGQNIIEARRVAEAVVEHVRTSPKLSLGVGTFGIKQQQVILDELDRLRREDPSIEWFFNQPGEKKFFVKNLENIQGDDRDVIFLSVTYGPDADGIVRRNFGPINKEGGWRRLNVLTTRAKRLMRVFSSMRPEQIDIEGVSEGAHLLRQYLKYAETGEYPSAKIPYGGADSPFETSVKRALERKGYRMVSQVGDAGYRIDLAVVDEHMPGRYLCGIECDGATYHSAATVRDRDRLRQQVLELRGWDIHRVWSTDWFHDPRAEIERLVALIEESRTRVERRDPTVPKRSAQAPPVTEPATNGRREPAPPRVELADIDVPPYRFAPVVDQGPPEAFYEVPVHVIAQATEGILEVEAPIYISELARRVAACWRMQRAGNQIVRRVENAVAYLQRKNVVTYEDGFVWLNSAARAPVRCRAIDGQTFSPEHISLAEVTEAVRLLLRHRAPLLPDQLVAETARLLGFARTGSRLRALIEAAKDQLVANGELRPGSQGIHLAQSAQN